MKHINQYLLDDTAKDFQNGDCFDILCTGGGMEPIIEAGQMLMIRKIDLNHISIGELLCYKRDNGKVIVRRLIKKINKDSKLNLLLKGDNRLLFDSPADQNKILGKVIAVEGERIDTLYFGIKGAIKAFVFFYQTKIFEIIDRSRIFKLLIKFKYRYISEKPIFFFFYKTITSPLQSLAGLFKLIKKNIRFLFYINFVHSRSGLKVKSYQEVDRGKLIEFMNVNHLTSIKLDDVLFDKYIKERARFSDDDFIAVLKGPEIVAIAMVEEDVPNCFQDQKAGIISTFFVHPNIKTEELKSYILNHLFRLAKRKAYSKLRIARSSIGILKGLNLQDDSQTIAYFLKKGFNFHSELYNMILEKDLLIRPNNITMINRKLANCGVIIRGYEKDDYNSLIRLIKIEFPYWFMNIRRILDRCVPALSIIVVEHNREIIGFGHFSLGAEKDFILFELRQILQDMSKWKLRDIGCLHIGGVQNKWRKKGVGQAMFFKSIEDLILKGANLIVASTIVPSFFKIFGFKTIERYVTLGINLRH